MDKGKTDCEYESMFTVAELMLLMPYMMFIASASLSLFSTGWSEPPSEIAKTCPENISQYIPNQRFQDTIYLPHLIL